MGSADNGAFVRAGKSLSLPIQYRRVWHDGFGARGWKLAGAMGDAEVIAATAETGDRIPTSVFVHDVFDHALCGLPLSGHRNEAVALVQLALRTGVSPRSDYAQMVDEDLLRGRVDGESLSSFLGSDWPARWPADVTDDAVAMQAMAQAMGKERLREALIERFFELGFAGAAAAMLRYAATGLAYRRRPGAALALQQVLRQVDAIALDQQWPSAAGEVIVDNRVCIIRLHRPYGLVERQAIPAATV